MKTYIRLPLAMAIMFLIAYAAPAQTNYVMNPSFDTVGTAGLFTAWPNSANNQASAARHWTMHSDNNNALIKSSMIPSTGPKGPRMLSVVCGGSEGGVYQPFDAAGNTVVNVLAHVYVIKGNVQLGVGVNGFTSQAVSTATHNQWQILSFKTDGSKLNNGVWVYNQDAQGGEFYVDYVEIVSACPPAPVLKNAGFDIAGTHGIKTNFPNPANYTESAARDWAMHSDNNNAPIITELVAAAGLLAGRNRILHVECRGSEGGVYQAFDAGGVSKIKVTARVLVKSGQVQLGIGVNGFTSVAQQVGPDDKWQTITVIGDGSKLNNGVWVYNQNPHGGNFYVSDVKIETVCN